MNKAFSVSGMHCNSCALNIDMTIEELEGVVSVKTDLDNKITKVEFDESKLSQDQIISEIASLGYTAISIN